MKFSAKITTQWTISERIFNRLRKVALVELVDRWHKEILHFHFKRDAYQKYSKAYLRRGKKEKRSPRRPLVLSGRMRDRMLRNKPKIRGTSKKVRAVLRYGRPKGMTQKSLRKSTWAMMERNNLSYRQAERRVYSNAGYGKANRKLFDERIRAFDDADRAFLEKTMQNLMTDKMNSHKARRRMRKR